MSIPTLQQPNGPLSTEKEHLLAHPIYSHVRDLRSLRIFMERHIVCVWDFMCVLKTLQRDLCGHQLPWTPPKDPLAARLINEITLDEESDVISDGRTMSHFNLYLEAMAEVGCDTRPIEKMIRLLDENEDPFSALVESDMPAENISFTLVTLAVLQLPLHVRAAAVFHSREDVIPPMFAQFVRSLRAEGTPCELLLEYLERHIEADGDHHGPASLSLTERLIGDDPIRRQEAFEGSRTAINARIALWDATLLAIQQG